MLPLIVCVVLGTQDHWPMKSGDQELGTIMFAYENHPMVLTPFGIHVFDGGRWTRTPLRDPIIAQRFVRTSAGIVYAEVLWRGEFVRIDPSTGEVLTVRALLPDIRAEKYATAMAEVFTVDPHDPLCVRVEGSDWRGRICDDRLEILSEELPAPRPQPARPPRLDELLGKESELRSQPLFGAPVFDDALSTFPERVAPPFVPISREGAERSPHGRDLRDPLRP